MHECVYVSPEVLEGRATRGLRAWGWSSKMRLKANAGFVLSCQLLPLTVCRTTSLYLESSRPCRQAVKLDKTCVHNFRLQMHRVCQPVELSSHDHRAAFADDFSVVVTCSCRILSPCGSTRVYKDPQQLTTCWSLCTCVIYVMTLLFAMLAHATSQ